RDGTWYRHGSRLPAFGLPVDDLDGGMPLARAVTPEPIRPVAPSVASPAPARLRLARAERPRPPAPLRCALAGPGRGAGGAVAACAGDAVMLMGRPLPATVAGERFWGDRVLVPLGLRTDPDLPEPALRAALGADEGAILVLDEGGVESVPRDAFRPLSRASVR